MIWSYYCHQKIIQKKLEIFRNFSGQTLDFLPGNQVFIYHVGAFSSLSIMNIEMLSLILIFLALEYFKNLCNFI